MLNSQQPTDFFGRVIHVGDFIAYPHRVSSSMEMKVGRVTKIKPFVPSEWERKRDGVEAIYHVQALGAEAYVVDYRATPYTRGWRLQKQSGVVDHNRAIVVPIALVPKEVLTLFGVPELLSLVPSNV